MFDITRITYSFAGNAFGRPKADIVRLIDSPPAMTALIHRFASFRHHQYVSYQPLWSSQHLSSEVDRTLVIREKRRSKSFLARSLLVLLTFSHSDLRHLKYLCSQGTSNQAGISFHSGVHHRVFQRIQLPCRSPIVERSLLRRTR